MADTPRDLKPTVAVVAETGIPTKDFMQNWAAVLRSIATLVSGTFTAPVTVPSYVKTALPSAAAKGQIIYVSNETGGAVLAFSDGTNWRRVTDRNVVS